MSSKVKCTCGWSWNKSDSSKKDMYICHECGRDNSNNMKNGGWLDNYNDSQASAPEGMEGDGFSNVGRNYSPAWGGQFQMGGSVYPVNYVPQAQMGGTIAGAPGFSYARTQGAAPSNGPYAKKTLPSAQNGKEMQYYQNGLDWQPKTISRDGSQLDKAQTGENVKFNIKQFLKDQNKKKISPQQQKINASVDKEAQSENYRRWTDSKEYKDQVKANKIANDRAIIADRKDRMNKSVAAQKKSFTKDNWRQQLADETQATGDKFRMFPEDPDSFIDEWMNPGVMIGNMASDLGSAPLRAQQEDSYMPYATSIGVPLLTGGLEGLGAKTTKQFVSNLANPFNIVPGYKSVEKSIGKALGTKEGLLSNAYKLNPYAFKPNLKMGYRMLGKEGFQDAVETGVLRAKPIPNQPSEGISLARNTNRNPNTGKMQGALDRPYFADGVIDERYAADYMAAVNKAENNLVPIATHKGIAPSQAGSIPLENATLYKKDWLQRYKEVPKQEDGGIIKDDRGQWDHPWEDTEISGDTMRTDGYGNIPLYVVPDVGEPRMVYPNTGIHTFPGATKFTEYPKGKKPNKAQNGLRQEQKGLQNLDNLTNFTNYNKPQPGGWLNKYN